MTTVHYIHLCAPNDNDGNPRRCFVVMDEKTTVLDVFDEEYNGRGEVIQAYPDVIAGPQISIPVSEWKSWVRYGEEIAESRK